jgi:hypothetical protein
MKKFLCVFILFGSLTSGSAAMAATQNVIFNGTIAATCVLVVNSNGTMTVSTDLKTLSSHNAGGSAGAVTLSTTGGVTISVDPVTVVTAPAADATPTSWSPTYATSGSHVFAEGGASHALVTPGVSTVTVDLAGTKSGANTFTQGNYQAQVTVRCEP